MPGIVRRWGRDGDPARQRKEGWEKEHGVGGQSDRKRWSARQASTTGPKSAEHLNIVVMVASPKC